MTPPRPDPWRLIRLHLGANLVYLAEFGMAVGPMAWAFFTLDGPVKWVLGVGIPFTIAVIRVVGLSADGRFHWSDRVRFTVRTALMLLGAGFFFAVGWNFLAWFQLILTVSGTLLTWDRVRPAPADATDAESSTNKSATQ